MAVCPNGHDSASEDFCDVCGMRIGGSPATPAASGTPGSTGIPAVGTPPAGTGGTPGSPNYGSSPTPGTPAGSPGPALDPADAGQPCPRCGAARSGQFCEACGFNFAASPYFTPTPPSPTPPSPPTSPRPSAPPAPPTQAATSAQARPSVPAGPSVPASPSVPAASSAPPTPTASPYAPAVWTAVVSADRDYYESVLAASDPDTVMPFPAYCAERRFRLVGNQMRIGRRSVSRGLEPEIDLTGPSSDPGISRLHAVLIAAPDGSWAVLDPGSANGTLVNGSEVRTGDQVPLHDGDRINLGAWTAITVHSG
jgi:FHA domain